MLWMQALLWIAFLLLPFTGKLHFTGSLSQAPFHRLPFTGSLSQAPFHRLPFTGSLSQAPFHRLPFTGSLSQAPFHRLPFTGSFGSPFCCSRSQASSTPARARSTIHGAGASGRTRGSLPRSSSCSGTRQSYGAPRGVRRGTTRCNTRGSRSRSMRSSPWRNSGQDTSNRWTRRRGVRTRRSCSSCAAGAPSDAIRRSMQRP